MSFQDIRGQLSQPTMTDPLDPYAAATQSAAAMLAMTPLRPRVAVILGSGMGDFADSLEHPISLPQNEIPHFPVPSSVGHAGRLVIGTLQGVPLAVLQGRVHYYEGYSIRQLAIPVRALRCMGIEGLLLTNAAGGINPAYRQGTLVLIRDHINLLGTNPLIGPNDQRFGPRFPDMTQPYDGEFRTIARDEAERRQLKLPEGVYAAVHGPSYETPAEIQFLARIGADLVGMSTVPEVIAARHLGMRVLAISCVTNMAAGLSGELIHHEEVLAIGQEIRGTLEALLRGILPRIAALCSEHRAR